MKKNITLLLASILVITLVTLAFASAATITISTPTAASRISGSSLDVNVTNTTAFDAMVNCTIYINSAALTANTTQITLNNTATNVSLSVVRAKISTDGIEDGTDYILNATCRNSSNALATTTITLTIDNGVPTTPTLSPATGTTDEDGIINFTGTVEGENTTACTLYFDGTNPGMPSYTMDHAGDSCSYQLTGIPDQTYNWYIGNEDGTNTTNSATATVHVDTTDSNGNVIAHIDSQVDSQGFVVTGEQTETPKWIVPLIVVLAVIGIGYLIARRK